jgi:hypothetical protein
MITKSIFEDEIIAGFQEELKKQASTKSAEVPNLVKAAENLHVVLEILENAGLTKQANQMLQLLEKIAKKPGDRHTKNLTSKRQVENIKDHGTQFNLSDDVGFVFEVPTHKDTLTHDDLDPEIADLLEIDSLDLDLSDDELLGLDDTKDSLSAFDKDVPLSDFEDERD